MLVATGPTGRLITRPVGHEWLAGHLALVAATPSTPSQTESGIPG